MSDKQAIAPKSESDTAGLHSSPVHGYESVSAKPIPFSTEMVRAILEGRKTQTRRVIKAPEWWEGHFNYSKNNTQLISRDGGELYCCPNGKAGDRLWVREKFYLACPIDLKLHKDCSSVYMPQWAPRITLAITDIRVERVQDISIDDISKEGINKNPDTMAHPITSFAALWDSINFKRDYGWEKNPWVWVITFKRDS